MRSCCPVVIILSIRLEVNFEVISELKDWLSQSSLPRVVMKTFLLLWTACPSSKKHSSSWSSSLLLSKLLSFSWKLTSFWFWTRPGCAAYRWESQVLWIADEILPKLLYAECWMLVTLYVWVKPGNLLSSRLLLVDWIPFTRWLAISDWISWGPEELLPLLYPSASLNCSWKRFLLVLITRLATLLDIMFL